MHQFAFSDAHDPAIRAPKRRAKWPANECSVTMAELEPVDPIDGRLSGLQCKWPVGPDQPYRMELQLFCGQPRPAAESYCPHHQSKAYPPGTEKARKAARDAAAKNRSPSA